MPLIILIDFAVVVVLVTVYKRRGLEAVLPYFVFIITLMPDECRINLGGLFDLYTRRLAFIVLAILFYSASRRGPIRAFPLKNLMYLHADGRWLRPCFLLWSLPAPSSCWHRFWSTTFSTTSS